MSMSFVGIISKDPGGLSSSEGERCIYLRMPGVRGIFETAAGVGVGADQDQVPGSWQWGCPAYKLILRACKIHLPGTCIEIELSVPEAGGWRD